MIGAYVWGSKKKGRAMKIELLCDIQAAKALNVSVGTLRNWRSSRLGGPAFIRVGRLVRYSESDLLEYLNRQRVEPAPANIRAES